MSTPAAHASPSRSATALIINKRLPNLSVKFACWMVRLAGVKQANEKRASAADQSWYTPKPDSRWVKLAQAIYHGEGVRSAIQRIYKLTPQQAQIKAATLVAFGVKSMLKEEKASRAYLGKKALAARSNRKKATHEKAAVLDLLAAGGLGAGIGAATSPKGNRAEGAGRGAGKGLGLYGGGVLGGGLGAMAGGMAGPSIARLIANDAGRELDPQIGAALALLGVVGGGAAGAIGGGAGGYGIASKLLGKPSWERDKAANANCYGATNTAAALPAAPSMSTTVPAGKAGKTLAKMS